MKKIFIVSLLILALTFQIDCNDNVKNYDFAKFNWGVSYKTILSKETSDLLTKADDRLIYNTEFKKYNCFLSYIFKEYKLISILYSFNVSIESSNDLYNLLKKELSNNYGVYIETEKEKEIQKYVKYTSPHTTIWENKDTLILLTLFTDDIIHLYFLPKNFSKYFDGKQGGNQ